MKLAPMEGTCSSVVQHAAYTAAASCLGCYSNLILVQWLVAQRVVVVGAPLTYLLLLCAQINCMMMNTTALAVDADLQGA